jgi:hypothetical protein
MARSSGSRRRKKGGSSAPVVYVSVAVAVLAVVALLIFIINRGEDDSPAARNGQLKVENYIKRGSSAVGNTYQIKASVMDVHSHGGSRLVEILTEDHHHLGIYVPAGTSLATNIRKGMDYVFTVKCANGMQADGSSVKGILIVVDVEAS